MTGGTTAFSSASDHSVATIASVNDVPVITINTGMTVAEQTTGSDITNAMLNEADVDGSAWIYTITSSVSEGTLRSNGVVISAGDTLTQQDINNGLLTYDHDGTETFSDSFGFTLADGGEDGSTPASGTFSITIIPVNDNAVSITSNGGGATAAVSRE